eukprot:CAMPEP_0183750530 /NCGR_PEP_ID=MMETSP0739-20130205/1158_1 /TAXON_ID=385413 /ORGANISM="Thalassiosira miniscula, Strain CCMP1093" /LENGTH=552 /DNA_ID=CAMNT_0025986591 /DNA_START=34 /DNA_END=1688 /DNA_ORIENTATION=-
MTRKLGKRGQGGVGDDDDAHCDGWSRAGASVSDRVMERMKMNLHLGSGDGNIGRSTRSSSSVPGERRRSISTGRARFGMKRSDRSLSVGRFRRDARSPIPFENDGNSIGGFRSESTPRQRGSTDRGVRPNLGRLRSRSSPRQRFPGGPPSPVGVDALEDIDDSTLGSKSYTTINSKGRSFAMRRTSSAHPRRSKKSKKKVDPVEYSLAQLHAMSEAELGGALCQAGVPPRDISRTLYEAAKIDHTEYTTAEEARKYSLVVLFVNSGCLKLVPREEAKDLTEGQYNRPMSSIGSSSSGDGDSQPSPTKSINASVGKGKEQISPKNSNVVNHVSFRPRESLIDNGKIVQIDSDAGRNKKEISIRADSTEPDLPKTVDATCAESSNSHSKKMTKNSKMEKIAELEKENVSVKTENKSLKKTLLKLLRQLTDALNEKEELKKITGKAGKKDELEIEESLAKRVQFLEQKYREEQEAHANTEIRLKAEINTLTVGSTKSLDENKTRTGEDRELISSLKQELRSATTKVKELTNEAKARDQLIETLSNVLLEKVGLGG